MIRKFLAATALLATSGVALAHGGYVYDSEPRVAFSVGTGPYSGFSMSYSSGPYWGPVAYAPAPVVEAPPPYYRVDAAPPRHAYNHRHHHRGHAHGRHDRY
jgi:hypothetical protein